MKEYIASVRDKESQRVMIIKSEEYSTKKEFMYDLRKNGYGVRFITTEENFDSDCEKYNEKLALQKRIRDFRRSYNIK